jgi:hypothetical protein
MRKSFCRAFVASILIVLLISPNQASAWGNTGHEAVAYVAWQHLTPTAKKKIIALLKLVPPTPGYDALHHQPATADGYQQWAAELQNQGIDPDSDKGQMYIFMRAATWPDSIKTVLSGSDNSQHDSTPDPSTGFADKEPHKYWHFVDNSYDLGGALPDVPKSCWVKEHGQAAHAPEPVISVPRTPPDHNAQTEIPLLETALTSHESPALKAYDLVWLEHLVGDIHQPLHAVARFIGGVSDEGGNCIAIHLAPNVSSYFRQGYDDDKAKGFAPPPQSFRAPDELHAFWDQLPGAASPKNEAFAATYAATLTDSFDDPLASKTDPVAWGDESFELAKKNAYKEPIDDTMGAPVALTIDDTTSTYFKDAKAIAAQRISLAGARLAKLLNKAFS